MSHIKIRVDGDIQKFLKRCKQLSAIDKKKLNATLGEAIRTSTVERFKTQRSPEGKKWVPSQRAKAEGGVTLVQTARLRNSIKSSSDSSGFAVGTNTIYAATHQEGTGGPVTIRAKTSKGMRFNVGGQWVRKMQVAIDIPARPFLGISKDDKKEIQDTLEDYFKKD